MRSQRFLYGLAVTALALGLVANEAIAEPNSNCLRELQLRGDTQTISTLRTALSLGPLARTGANDCRGVQIAIETRGDLIFFRLSTEGRSVEHSSASVAVIASWIESWLFTTTESEEVRAAVDDETPLLIAPPVLSRTVTKKVTRPLRFGASTLVDYDQLGAVWPGIDLSFAADLSDKFWLGATGVAATTLVGDTNRRDVYRMSARAGWHHATSWGSIRAGLGLGVYAASIRQPDSNTITASASGPFAEGQASIDFKISRNWALTLGTSLRTHVSGDLGLEGQHAEGTESSATGTNAASGTLGFTWSLGGD